MPHSRRWTNRVQKGGSFSLPPLNEGYIYLPETVLMSE